MNTKLCYLCEKNPCKGKCEDCDNSVCNDCLENCEECVKMECLECKYYKCNGCSMRFGLPKCVIELYYKIPSSMFCYNCTNKLK